MSANFVEYHGKEKGNGKIFPPLAYTYGEKIRKEVRVLTFLGKLCDAGVGILLPLILVGCGLYFTVYLGGFYLLHPAKPRRLSPCPSPLRERSVSGISSALPSQS